MNYNKMSVEKGIKNNEVIAYLLLILTMVIWGGTWPLGRWLVSKEVGGATIPPLMIAVIRYFLAIICFFPILRVSYSIMPPLFNVNVTVSLS